MTLYDWFGAQKIHRYRRTALRSSSASSDYAFAFPELRAKRACARILSMPGIDPTRKVRPPWREASRAFGNIVWGHFATTVLAAATYDGATLVKTAKSLF
ncbi:MAG: hypothetical protein WAN43_08880 [Rhodomicrobium sp.]